MPEEARAVSPPLDELIRGGKLGLGQQRSEPLPSAIDAGIGLVDPGVPDDLRVELVEPGVDVAAVEGQVRGIEKMVEEDRYCIEIVTQITAAQAALDKVALELLEDHAHHCVIGAKTSEQGERTEELMGAVKRLMRQAPSIPSSA